MKSTMLACLGFFLLGLSPSAFADEPARVTEAINKVHYGPSQSAVDTHPATTGTPIQDGQFVGTGISSRAELRLPTTSIVRIGSNTIYNYTVASNTINLQQGTLLFCKPKAATELHIKTAAIMAGIVGTTGFTGIQKDTETGPTTYHFGIIEGHATAHVNGKSYPIGPGYELVYSPPSQPVVLPFDLPKMIKTSKLFTEFKTHLPNQSYIDEEIATYNDQVSRGFIQPPGGTQTNTNFAGFPTPPPTALDSAQNAQGDQGKGGPPSNR